MRKRKIFATNKSLFGVQCSYLCSERYNVGFSIMLILQLTVIVMPIAGFHHKFVCYVQLNRFNFAYMIPQIIV